MGAMQPEFEDETPLNPFDFWAGGDFKVKIKKVAGFWNYDSSEFSAAKPLLKDDDALEAIWKKEYSLAELVSTDKFKTYDELKKRLDSVLKITQAAPARQVVEEEDIEREPVVAAAPAAEDDALSYFQQLAEE